MTARVDRGRLAGVIVLSLAIAAGQGPAVRADEPSCGIPEGCTEAPWLPRPSGPASSSTAPAPVGGTTKHPTPSSTSAPEAPARPRLTPPPTDTEG